MQFTQTNWFKSISLVMAFMMIMLTVDLNRYARAADPYDDPANLDTNNLEFQYSSGGKIAQLAAELGNNPVKIHEFVHNEIEYRPYKGLMKGALGALEDRVANDMDQAALLMILLRESGVPCRYMMGDISIPVDRCANWLGKFDLTTSDKGQKIAAILNQMGITANYDGDDSIDIEDHVWVEAYVDYYALRGRNHEAGTQKGEVWIKLDPSFNFNSYRCHEGILNSVGIDSVSLMKYIRDNLGYQLTTDEWVYNVPEEDITDKLETWSEKIQTEATRRGLAPHHLIEYQLSNKKLDVLPANLPFTYSSETVERMTDLLDTDFYSMEINVIGPDGYLFTTSVSKKLAEIYGKEVVLYFDENQADGKLKVRLDIDGSNEAESPPVLDKAEKVTLEVIYSEPILETGVTTAKEYRLTTEITAGSFYNIIPGTGETDHEVVMAKGLGTDTTSRFERFNDTLKATGLLYQYQTDYINKLAAQLNHVLASPKPGMTLVSYEIEKVGENPIQPVGLQIRRVEPACGVVSLNDKENTAKYNFLRDFNNSMMAGIVIEELTDQEAIFAAQTIVKANSNAAPIKTYQVNDDNWTDVNSFLYSGSANWDAVEADFADTIQTGAQLNTDYEYFLPEDKISLQNNESTVIWEGSGAISIDSINGHTGDYLPGGLTGGILADSNIGIDDLISDDPGNFAAFCGDETDLSTYLADNLMIPQYKTESLGWAYLPGAKLAAEWVSPFDEVNSIEAVSACIALVRPVQDAANSVRILWHEMNPSLISGDNAYFSAKFSSRAACELDIYQYDPENEIYTKFDDTHVISTEGVLLVEDYQWNCADIGDYKHRYELRIKAPGASQWDDVATGTFEVDTGIEAHIDKVLVGEEEADPIVLKNKFYVYGVVSDTRLKSYKLCLTDGGSAEYILATGNSNIDGLIGLFDAESIDITTTWSKLKLEAEDEAGNIDSHILDISVLHDDKPEVVINSVDIDGHDMNYPVNFTVSDDVSGFNRIVIYCGRDEGDQTLYLPLREWKYDYPYPTLKTIDYEFCTAILNSGYSTGEILIRAFDIFGNEGAGTYGFSLNPDNISNFQVYPDKFVYQGEPDNSYTSITADIDIPPSGSCDMNIVEYVPTGDPVVYVPTVIYTYQDITGDSIAENFDGYMNDEVEGPLNYDTPGVYYEAQIVIENSIPEVVAQAALPFYISAGLELEITQPEDPGLTGVVTFEGSAYDVNFESYTLSYINVSDWDGNGTAPAEDKWFSILNEVDDGEGGVTTQKEFEEPVRNGVLGHWDTTGVANGTYWVELRLNYAGGGGSAAVYVQYNVHGNIKIGNVTFSQRDLGLSVPGFQMEMVRTYNSLDQRDGPFGYCWSYENYSVNLQKIDPESSGYPHAYIELPDGRTEYFTNDPKNWQYSGELIGSGDSYAIFHDLMDFFDGLSHKPTPKRSIGRFYVKPKDYLEWGFACSWPTAIDAELGAGECYLKTDDGFEYVMAWDKTGYDTGEMIRMRMPDGKTIYFNDGTDEGVFIEKDVSGSDYFRGLRFNKTSGRIDAVISYDEYLLYDGDPDTDDELEKYVYTYETMDQAREGNLIKVEFLTKDESGAFQTRDTTEYIYDEENFPRLISEMKKNSVSVMTWKYDDYGRLEKIINAQGQEIVMSHDPDSRIEVVTAPGGYNNIIEYDDRGQVISRADPLGRKTSYTYDADGNKKTETTPLGHTTSYDYDGDGNITSMTDPIGNTVSASYSGNKLTSVKDHLGNTSSFTYDGEQIETVTDPWGRTATNSYWQGTNLLKDSTDAFGNVTSYVYDDNGNPTETTSTYYGSSDTYTSTSVYNLIGKLHSQTDNNDNTTIYGYDDQGRQNSVTDPFGNISSTVYDSVTGLKDYDLYDPTNGISDKTSYFYDEAGRQTKVISHDNNGSDAMVSESIYDPTRGTLSRSLSYLANETDEYTYTDYEYDAAGQQTRVTYGLKPTGGNETDLYSTKSIYDDDSRLTASRSARGYWTYYTYDELGRQTLVEDAFGHSVETVYNEAGQAWKAIDQLGRTVENEYDIKGQLQRVIYPDGSSVGYTYDDQGRKITECDQAGVITSFTYDAEGRLDTVTDGLGNVTSYGYDHNDTTKIDTKTTTDAENKTVTVISDRHGRLQSKELPNGETETWYYPEQTDGQISVHRDVLDNDSVTVPGNYGRTDLRKYYNGHYDTTSPVIDKQYAYSYDYWGRTDKVTVSESGAGTENGDYEYTYDQQGRTVAVDYPGGKRVEYDYNDLGDLLAVRTKVGAVYKNVTTYDYDELGRLSLAVGYDADDTTGAPAGTNITSVSYVYDAVGRLESATEDGNGTRTLYSYDELDRVILVRNERSDSSLITEYEYELGPTGVRTGMIERVAETGGVKEIVYDYTYDDIYRLTEEVRTCASDNTGDYRKVYAYDNVGNRTDLWEYGTDLTTLSDHVVYTYGVNDILDYEDHYEDQASVQYTIDYTYDAAGRLTQKVDGGTSKTTGYTWNHENRLVRVDDLPNGDSYHFGYDIYGNRIWSEQWDDSDNVLARTDYVVDTKRGFAEVLEEWTTADPGEPSETITDVKSYFFARDLMCQVDDGTASYFHYDALGTTRAITTGPTADLSQHYEYTAFGEHKAFNSTGGSVTASTDHLYTGERYDAVLSQYYLRARMYDQTTGRFTSRDPISDPNNPNPYAYVANNPVNAVDLSGELTLAEATVVTAICGIIRDLSCQAGLDVLATAKRFIPGVSQYYKVLKLMDTIMTIASLGVAAVMAVVVLIKILKLFAKLGPGLAKILLNNRGHIYLPTGALKEHLRAFANKWFDGELIKHFRKKMIKINKVWQQMGASAARYTRNLMGALNYAKDAIYFRFNYHVKVRKPDGRVNYLTLLMPHDNPKKSIWALVGWNETKGMFTTFHMIEGRSIRASTVVKVREMPQKFIGLTMGALMDKLSFIPSKFP